MNTKDETAPAAQPLNARERAFWHAVWLLEGVTYLACAFVAYLVIKLLGRSPLNAAIAIAAAGVVFAVTHYGLWCLTRPYATTAEPVMPEVDRPSLCKIDFKLMFVLLTVIPAGEFTLLSDYTIVYVGGAAAFILAWIALLEPLKAANARDAARNAELAS
jgi:hypothetical protein